MPSRRLDILDVTEPLRYAYALFNITGPLLQASESGDGAFVPAFKHILLYTSVWLSSLIVFVVVLALLLHGRAGRASAAYRFLYYIPGALAGVWDAHGVVPQAVVGHAEGEALGPLPPP